MTNSTEIDSKQLIGEGKALLSVDRSGMIESISPGMCEIIGVKEEAIIGKPFESIVHNSVPEFITWGLKNNISHNNAAQTPMKFSNKNDGFWAMLTAAPKSKEGESTAFVAYLGPITDEEENKAIKYHGITRNKKFKLVTPKKNSIVKEATFVQQIAGAGILIGSGVVLEIMNNMGVITIPVMSAADLVKFGVMLIGLLWISGIMLLMEMEFSKTSDLLEKLRRSDLRDSREIKIFNKRKKRGRWLEKIRYNATSVSRALLSDAARQTYYSLVKESDLNNVEAMQEKLKEVLIGQQDMISKISHDIRNPVNTIMGLCGEMQASTDISPVHRRYLNMIEGGGISILKMMENVITYMQDSMSEKGHQIVFEPFNIREEIWKWGSSLSFQATQNDTVITTYFDDNLGDTVTTDKQLVEHIVMNLAANAIKFTQKGFVDIKVGCGNKNEIVIVVRDSGAGIKEENLSKIFEAFEQVNINDRESGFGLGLAIVKKSCQALKGTVTVKSTIGEGTTFTVTLPVESIGERRTPELPSNDRGSKVVVIEDSEHEKQNLVKTLESLGYTVVSEGDQDADIVFAGVVRSSNVIDSICKSHKNALLVITHPYTYDISEMLNYTTNTLTKPFYDQTIIDCIKGGEPETQVIDTQFRTLGKLSVLIVDDQKSNRDIIKIFLDKSGYNLNFATNGADAIEMAKTGDYDCILMDLRMPNMSGSEACKTIKEDMGEKAPIVIMCSGDVTEDKTEKAKSDGVDKFLAKPINKKVLLQELSSLEEKLFPERFRKSLAIEKNKAEEVDLPEDMIFTFLADTKKAFEEWQSYDNNEDKIAKGIEVAHNLKGTGGIYGYSNLAMLGDEMQNFGEKGDLASMEEYGSTILELLTKETEI